MDSFNNPNDGQEPEIPRGSINLTRVLIGAALIALVMFKLAQLWLRSNTTPVPAPPQTNIAVKPKPPPKSTPKVAVGDTRERVIEVLGEPKSSGRMGVQEFLIYSNGEIVIEGGVAISVEIGAERKRGEVQAGESQIILRQGGRILDQHGKPAGP